MSDLVRFATSQQTLFLPSSSGFSGFPMSVGVGYLWDGETFVGGDERRPGRIADDEEFDDVVGARTRHPLGFSRKELVDFYWKMRSYRVTLEDIELGLVNLNPDPDPAVMTVVGSEIFTPNYLNFERTAQSLYAENVNAPAALDPENIENISSLFPLLERERDLCLYPVLQSQIQAIRSFEIPEDPSEPYLIKRGSLIVSLNLLGPVLFYQNHFYPQMLCTVTASGGVEENVVPEDEEESPYITGASAYLQGSSVIAEDDPGEFMLNVELDFPFFPAPKAIPIYTIPLLDLTNIGTITGTITVDPVEYWPYADSNGDPIYNTTTGARLRNPLG